MPGHVYVTPVPKPGRNPFNLSYENKFTCDMGRLYPTAKEVMPGDVLSIDATMVCRTFPLVAPTLHNIRLHYDWFFVPYRLLWDSTDPDNFEQFITGGDDGTAAP